MEHEVHEVAPGEYVFEVDEKELTPDTSDMPMKVIEPPDLMKKLRTSYEPGRDEGVMYEDSALDSYINAFVACYESASTGSAGSLERLKHIWQSRDSLQLEGEEQKEKLSKVFSPDLISHEQLVTEAILGMYPVYMDILNEGLKFVDSDTWKQYAETFTDFETFMLETAGKQRSPQDAAIMVDLLRALQKCSPTLPDDIAAYRKANADAEAVLFREFCGTIQIYPQVNSQKKKKSPARRRKQPESKTANIADSLMNVLEEIGEPETFGKSWLQDWDLKDAPVIYKKAISAKAATETRKAMKAQPAVTNYVSLMYEVEESGQVTTDGPQPLGKIVITGKPFGPKERYTHDGVCNLLTPDRQGNNGHWYIWLSEIAENLYHSRYVKKETMADLLNTIMKLKAERLVIDIAEERKLLGGIDKNGEPIPSDVLSSPLLPIGDIRRIDTEKTFDACFEITKTPVIYQYCQIAGQVVTYNRAVGYIREVREDGELGAKIPYTPEHIAIEEYMFRRVARVKRGTAHKTILFSTVLEQSGTSSPNHKLSTERRQYIVKVLKYWKAIEFINGYTTDAEGTGARKNAVATKATILTGKDAKK